MASMVPGAVGWPSRRPRPIPSRTVDPPVTAARSPASTPGVGARQAYGHRAIGRTWAVAVLGDSFGGPDQGLGPLMGSSSTWAAGLNVMICWVIASLSAARSVPRMCCRVAGPVLRRNGGSWAMWRLLRMRQWVEVIFGTLTGQLSLEQHGARRHPVFTPV